MKLLSNREFALFHIKSVRTLIRIIWRARQPENREQTLREYTKTLEVLSAICGKNVEEADLIALFQKTRREKIYTYLFVWF